MAFIDYYKIMGISKDTPQKDIKAAYKKRAKQFHPDLHPDDPKAKAKFQALNEAYDVLSDPEKRAKYDQYGEHWKSAEAGTVDYADRECTVNIDMYTALLGGSIIVQTPENDKLKLNIKPGTQPGTKVRLKGKGDMHPDGTRGNLILTYNVQLPTNLTERQKEFLQQMRKG